MKNKKKTSTASEIKLSQPILIKIQAEEKTSVPTSGLYKLAFILVTFLLVTSLVGIGFFVLGTTVDNLDFDQNIIPASVTVDWPRWVSVQDPFKVKVILHNNGQVPLNGNLDVILTPSASLGMEENGITSVKFEELSPGNSLTQVYHFIPLELPTTKVFDIKVVLRDGTNTLEIQNNRKISVVNIPRLQVLLQWILGGSGTFAALSALFWDQLKKALSLA